MRARDFRVGYVIIFFGRKQRARTIGNLHSQTLSGGFVSGASGSSIA
jgi:hypothetical protein